MIYRSEYGARCTHCRRLNPASVLEGPGVVDCVHCRQSFSYWIERLPFFCTEDPATSPEPAPGGAAT